jgi:hypothetical protein
VCFRARLRSKKKLEKTFWTDKNLELSPKEDFSQKRPILQSASPEFLDLNRALKYMNPIIFGKK